VVERTGFAAAPWQHDQALSGTLATQPVCPQGEHVCSLWRELCTCRPLHLWGRRTPTTGVFFYVNAWPAILQPFLCVVSLGVAESLGPLAPRPHPTRAPGRMPYTSTPLHALFLRDVHVPPKAALRCADVVDPTSSQRVPSPRQYTTPSATRSRPSRGVPACPSVFQSHLCQQLGTGHLRFGVPTGDQGAYLRGTRVRTYGGPGCVPTGDQGAYLRGTRVRTYGRRISI
jgi:hypothetical protein